MKLPITCAVATSVNPDGTFAVTGTYTDANSAVLDRFSFIFASETKAMEIIGAIHARTMEVATANITAADLPASFSVQIGLDTSLRNLDLL